MLLGMSHTEGWRGRATPLAAAATAGVLALYEVEGARVVVVHGDQDADTVAPLAAALTAAVADGTRVIVEASKLGFADSSFLNVLLSCHRHGDLRLVAPTPALRRLLDITGAGAVVRVLPTVEAALAS
jgi:anti-anti-sigma factor